ncbi:MAG: hypothetical protein ABI612_10460, partial [Betaproteobacteria bacterium]
MTIRELAKLTRPRLTGVVARDRLFAALEKCSSPAIWICGPAGAGKTMVVASWLEKTKRPVVWYQIDAGDNDPSSFFYYLRSSVRTRRRPLPLLTAEYHASLAGFSRRFFRDFFGRFAAGGVLVLDGFPAAPDCTALAAVLHEAVQEIPPGVTMLVIARELHPESFTRLRLQGLIGLLAWDQLRLTFAESQSMIAQIATLDETTQRILHDQCEGWAAGLRILLEHYRGTGQIVRERSLHGRDALLGFFATDVFDHLREETRMVLLRVSLLRSVTEVAATTMSGNARAWSLLSTLNQRHVFVDKLVGREPMFQLHGLFREFLVARARATLGPNEFNVLQRRTAALLVKAGVPEQAVPLLTDAGDWAAAGRLIMVHSSRLLASGHLQTLRNWLRALPTWYVDATPRLLYCLGVAQSATDPTQARITLGRAYQRFVAERNPLGEALAAAAVIQSYYFAFDHFTGAEQWIAAVRKLVDEGLSFPSAEAELHVRSMVLIATTFTQPDAPWLGQWADTILQRLTRGAETNQMLVSAAILLPYFDWFAPAKARLLAVFVQSLLESADVTLFNRVWWLLAACLHHYYEDDRDELRQAAQAVRSIVESHALRGTSVMAAQLRLWEAFSCEDSGATSELMSHALATLNPTRRQEELNLRVDAAAYCLSRNDPGEAAVQARRAIELARETAVRISEATAGGLLALALAQISQPEEAMRVAQTARELVKDKSGGRLEFDQLLIEAYVTLTAGRQKVRVHDLLKRALELGQRHGYVKNLFWVRSIMERLCAEAIDAGIETRYVTGLIQRHRLSAPDSGCEKWPWAVRVFTLGQFQVQVGGVPLVFSGKVQKKPLELLKLLIVRGRGGTDAALVAQLLWPDTDGDAAEAALRMTLHRLRKLLENEDNVVLRNGRLQLDARRCWVDAWAFEAACDAAEYSVRVEQKQHI